MYFNVKTNCFFLWFETNNLIIIEHNVIINYVLLTLQKFQVNKNMLYTSNVNNFTIYTFAN